MIKEALREARRNVKETVTNWYSSDILSSTTRKTVKHDNGT